MKTLNVGNVYLFKGKKLVVIDSLTKKKVTFRTAGKDNAFGKKQKTVALDMANFSVVKKAKAKMMAIFDPKNLKAAIDKLTGGKKTSGKKAEKKTSGKKDKKEKAGIDKKAVKALFSEYFSAVKIAASPKSEKKEIKTAKKTINRLTKKFTKLGLAVLIKKDKIVIGAEKKGKVRKAMIEKKASKKVKAYFAGGSPKKKGPSLTGKKKTGKKTADVEAPSKEDEGFIVRGKKILDAEVISVSKKNQTVKVAAEIDGKTKKVRVPFAEFYTKKKDAKAAKKGTKDTSKKSTPKVKVCGSCKLYKKSSHDCKHYEDLTSDEPACKYYKAKK